METTETNLDGLSREDLLNKIADLENEVQKGAPTVQVTTGVRTAAETVPLGPEVLDQLPVDPAEQRAMVGAQLASWVKQERYEKPNLWERRVKEYQDAYMKFEKARINGQYRSQSDVDGIHNAALARRANETMARALEELSSIAFKLGIPENLGFSPWSLVKKYDVYGTSLVPPRIIR